MISDLGKINYSILGGRLFADAKTGSKCELQSNKMVLKKELKKNPVEKGQFKPSFDPLPWDLRNSPLNSAQKISLEGHQG